MTSPENTPFLAVFSLLVVTFDPFLTKKWVIFDLFSDHVFLMYHLMLTLI